MKQNQIADQKVYLQQVRQKAITQLNINFHNTFADI